MRFCWPQWIFIALVIILGFGSMLSGCGKKGPLYLQDTEQKVKQQKTTKQKSGESMANAPEPANTQE